MQCNGPGPYLAAACLLPCPAVSYPIRNQQGLYFLTFTVVGWVDIFTRQAYRTIVIESLRHCQQHKGLELYAYCLMSNHLHLIARAAEGFELSAIMRDFKKYTSKKMVEDVGRNPQESRRRLLEWVFEKQGQFNPNNTYVQFWQQPSHSIELTSVAVTQQKLDYIHQNPVRAGICYRPEDYLYSSASFYAGLEAVLPVMHLF